MDPEICNEVGTITQRVINKLRGYPQSPWGGADPRQVAGPDDEVNEGVTMYLQADEMRHLGGFSPGYHLSKDIRRLAEHPAGD